jgi:hypothetical protein
MYNTLPPDSFRVLNLFPAELSDFLLYGNIVTKQLQVRGSADKPSSVGSNNKSYEALLYTWGTAVAGAGLSIRVGDQAVPITRNLHDALMRLRHVTNTRTLWIDQICINQDNVAERNSQVAIMSRIYRSAARVLIWLGDADDSLLDPFRFQKVLFREANAARLKAPTSESAGYESAEQLRYGGWSAIMGSVLAMAFHGLFDKPWFTRAWVIQEAVLATDAIVYCGAYHTPFRRFDRAVSVLRKAGILPTPTSMSLIQLIRSQKSTSDVKRLGLADLLHLTYKLESKLPHDKIYALLGLVVDGGEPAYAPDYDEGITDVYHRAAAHMITTSNSLDILACVSWPKNLEKLPSWVPDWTCPPQVSQPFAASTPGSFSHEIIVLDGRLITHGRRLDTIHSIGSYMHKADLNDDLEEDAAARWDEMITVSALAHSMPFDMVRRKLLIAVNAESATEEERTTRLYNAYFSPVVRARDLTYTDWDALAADESSALDLEVAWSGEFQFMIDSICSGRAAILTARNKYLILGPGGVIEADEVWRLANSELCFILRPGEEVATWRLLGACYLQVPYAGLVEEPWQPLVII